jgi:hypothetical protein
MNPRDSVWHAPLVRQAQHAAQNRKTAVGRSWAHLSSTRLRERFHCRLVNFIQLPIGQGFEGQTGFGEPRSSTAAGGIGIGWCRCARG